MKWKNIEDVPEKERKRILEKVAKTFLKVNMDISYNTEFSNSEEILMEQIIEIQDTMDLADKCMFLTTLYHSSKLKFLELSVFVGGMFAALTQVMERLETDHEFVNAMKTMVRTPSEEEQEELDKRDKK